LSISRDSTPVATSAASVVPPTSTMPSPITIICKLSSPNV